MAMRAFGQKTCVSLNKGVRAIATTPVTGLVRSHSLPYRLNCFGLILAAKHNKQSHSPAAATAHASLMFRFFLQTLDLAELA
jgi:hypothetical protein